MATKKNDEEKVSQDIKATSSSYRALDNSGNDYASMVGMSDLDKAALEAAGKSWAEANKAGDQAGMDAAHKQAEAIRGQYGYSGGGDGSQYIPTGTKREEFSYESAPSYTSKYQSQIDELTEAILGRDPFEYNYEDDPNYQQYKESYTRSGQRAMQDTLGQVSARTGGLASSYATTASQQTYDNYMAALADKIPELRQLAYAMYQDEGNEMRANLEMLMALEQGDYAKYQDLLTQYNTDRNFDYGIYRDDISDSRYDKEWNYQVGRDEIEDKRYEDETAWNREQYESEEEYNRALEKAQTLAAAGDFSGYKALGYTDAEIANLKSAYDKAQAAARVSYSGSGSSGGGSSGGSSGSSSQSGIVDTMLGFGNDTKAYEYLLSLDMSNAKTETLWSLYESARGGGGSIPTFSDRDSAVAYMKEQGVPSGNIAGMMTRTEWARRKASYQQYGQGGTEVTEYDSYTDYMNAYVEYCIETYGG